MYECNICKYNAKDSSNLTKHNKTKKHLKKESKLIKDNVIQTFQQTQLTLQEDISKYMCRHCGKVYKYDRALEKHYEMCEYVEKLKIDCENKIKSRDEKIESLESQLTYLKSMLNVSGVILNKSVSTLQYVINTYKTSPPFKIMDNIPSIENNGGDYDNDAPDDTDPITKNTKFVEILIYKYKNDSLIKYLGDFIIKNYKKGDPKLQSIWNSDTARMSYIIRHQIDENNAEWRSDKKGVLATKIAIDPLLKHIEESIVKYYTSPNMQMNPNDASYESLYERVEGVTKMKQYIEEKIVSASILKYIAPYFYLTKDDNLMCIK